MEHLDLFTPVEELKDDGKYFLVRNGSYIFTPYGKVWFDEESNKWYDNQGKIVTHVLDLSKLTTKEKVFQVVEAIQGSFLKKEKKEWIQEKFDL